jgi:hypothetical protein
VRLVPAAWRAAVYLRLNERVVPAIYGPFADDQRFA